MKVYVVGCGRARSGRTPAALAQAIRQLGASWQCRDSTWLIQTTLSAVEILDRLKEHVELADELLVARLSEEIAWSGFPEDGARWLHEHIVPGRPPSPDDAGAGGSPSGDVDARPPEPASLRRRPEARPGADAGGA